jgi:hypothetical protein
VGELLLKLTNALLYMHLLMLHLLYLLMELLLSCSARLRVLTMQGHVLLRKHHPLILEHTQLRVHHVLMKMRRMNSIAYAAHTSTTDTKWLRELVLLLPLLHEHVLLLEVGSRYRRRQTPRNSFSTSCSHILDDSSGTSMLIRGDAWPRQGNGRLLDDRRAGS